MKLSYTEKRTTAAHTFRAAYQNRDKELGDNLKPETDFVGLGKKPKREVEAKAE